MAAEADAAGGALARSRDDDVFVSATASDGTNPAQDAVIHAWLDIEGFVERAGKGKLVRLLTGLDRQALVDNSALLQPVISFYGRCSA